MNRQGRFYREHVRGWKKLFDRATLKQGRMLVKGGACYMPPLSEYEESVTVKVTDGAAYTVDAVFPGIESDKMQLYCTCGSEKLCRHIAAALYYYEKKDSEREEESLNEKKRELELSEQLLRMYNTGCEAAENGDPKAAVDYVCKVLGNIRWDDVHAIQNEANAVLNATSENKETREQAFDAITQHYRTEKIEHIRTILVDALFEHFCCPPFIERLIALAQEEAGTCRGDEKWWWLHRKIEVIQTADVHSAEPERICLENLSLRGARKWLSDDYYQKDDIPAMIRMYEATLLLPEIDDFERRDCYEQLSMCYKEMFEREKYMACQWALVKELHVLYPLSTMRKYYDTAEWERLCSELIAECPEKQKINLYAELNREDLIWEALQSEPFSALERYEYDLLRYCPEKYLSRYEAHCQELAANVRHLSDARRCIHAVLDLGFLEGGRAIADRLIEQWKQQYSDNKLFVAYLVRVTD